MLDSQSFPHILDLIVAFAPPASLLALRACSRDLHARADARLFEHLEVVFPTPKIGDCYDLHMPIYPDSAIDVAVQPFRSNLRFEWLRTRRPGGPDGTATAEDLEARARLRKYVHKHVTSARILDLLWATYNNCDMAFLARVQACLATNEINEQTNIRVFAQPGAYDNFDCSCQPDFYKFECHATQVHFGNMEGTLGYRRLVRVLPCCPGDVAAGHDLLLFGGDTYELSSIAHRELVVHLLSTDDPAYRIRNTGITFLETLVYEVIPRVDNLGCEIPTITTVVGGAEECRASVGLAPTASQDALYSALQDITMRNLDEGTIRMRVYDPDSNTSELRMVSDVDAYLREHIFFLTPEEYAAKVGTEQFALETKPDPTTGPPATYLL